MNKNGRIWWAAAVVMVIGMNASAVMIDLTTVGASGSVNGAIFSQATFEFATGTGLFEPFVHLQGKGIQQGYNTSGTVEWDTKSVPWTRSIQLGQVPIVGDYYEFRLDINENKACENRFLSLDEIKIHIVSEAIGGGLTGYDTNPDFGLPAWQLGDGNWIKLDYALNPGSGNGDMIALIPVSALGSDGSSYVYFYSKFGAMEGLTCDAGFEEWGVSAVPEPITLVLMMAGGLCLRSRRYNQR